MGRGPYDVYITLGFSAVVLLPLLYLFGRAAVISVLRIWRAVRGK